MLCKHEAKPQWNNDAEPQSQQNRFATLLRSYPATGTASNVKRILKYLNYKKFLFTVVKINLLTLKMDK